MAVLMLVKGFDAPVIPSPGRWLIGETVALAEVDQVLSQRESNPPQDNGGFYQVTITDRVKTDPDMQEYLAPWEDTTDPENPVLLKRRRLELDENGLGRLILPNTGYLAIPFTELTILTDDAENP